MNPVAGKGGGISALPTVLGVLYEGGYIPSVFFTSGVGDATRLVLEHGANYDCVTCVGGDGTLSETVSGLARLPNPPLLGYIPQGTANDVASTLKLSKSPALAAKTVIHGRPITIDVGRFNINDYFAYIAAFGAFTEVSYETSREIKHTLGHLGYVLTAMSKLPTITDFSVRVEHDRGVIEDRLIFGSISNSTSFAGIVKLDDSVVELDDGLFEVLLIQTPSNLVELNNIISHLLVNDFSGSNVTLLRSKKVKITFDHAVKWTRDGEAGGSHKLVELENIPKAIRIMT